MSIVSALSKLLIKMGGEPKSGDNTDELVNKIADAYNPGGESSVLLINYDDITNELDKTWKEIHDALADGIICIVAYSNTDWATMEYIVSALQEESDRFVLYIGTNAIDAAYIASSANGYPVKNV